MELLSLIKNRFNHGKVIVRKEDMYRYYCDTFVGLASIITYFESFPLKTKKAVTLDNWKQVYNMVINKQHLTEEAFNKVRNLKNSSNVTDEDSI